MLHAARDEGELDGEGLVVEGLFEDEADDVGGQLSRHGGWLCGPC